MFAAATLGGFSGAAAVQMQRSAGWAEEEDDPYLCHKQMMSKSSWKPPAEATRAAANNFCAEGKLLPELYVLGAPKASTTSMSIDLSKAGVGCVQKVKESNWWGKKLVEFNFSFATDPASISRLRAEWLEAMPPCPQARREVIGDFSPGYLSMVPSNAGVDQTLNLPSMLRAMYATEAAARRVTLTVMIREPLARIHSHWYYSGPSGYAFHRNQPLPTTFSADLEGFLSGSFNEFRMKQRVWYSSYGAQLQQWQQHFSPEQFLVVPIKAYVEDGLAVCNALSERLAFQIGCTAETSHGMKNKPYPSLMDDVTPEIRERFLATIEEDTNTLLKVLASGQAKGMHLPRYEGAEGSESDVRAWLERYW